MRLDRYFDDEVEWERPRVVRRYKPGDLPTLLTHLSDLVGNLDMLLLAAKGHSNPLGRHFSRALAGEDLADALGHLDEISARIQEAKDICSG